MADKILRHPGPHGWLNLYKPVGVSSNYYLNTVRRAFGKHVRVGHAGTLDPMADGVLPVAVGAATRMIEYLQECVKVYSFTITWGVSTDSLDSEGNVTAVSHVRPSFRDVDACLPMLTGHVMQTPPLYSAIKRNGKRLCDLARSGEQLIEPPKARPAVIYHLKRIRHNHESADFIAYVGKGVYVRSIARDICSSLGAEGHVTALTRERYGFFFKECSFLLAEANQSLYKNKFEARLCAADSALDDIPAMRVSADEAKRLRDGQEILTDVRVSYATRVALYDDKGRFFAIATIGSESIKADKVFHIDV